MSNIETTRVMGTPGAIPDRTLAAPGVPGATLQMPGQADAFRTQMGGTTTCPVCKSTTPLMEPYCGDCGFLLTSAPAEEVALPAEETPPAELVDNQTGRRYRLRAGVNTLGRQGTDVLVNDGTVSRNHATITVENGAVTIEDLGSSNGTKVGDQRIGPNQPTPAVSGTPLRFGNWNVVLEVASAAAGAGGAQPTIAMPAATPAATTAATPDKTMVGGAFSDEATFVADAAPAAAPVPAPAPVVEPVTGGALVGTLRKIEGLADDITVTEGVISLGRRPGNTVVLGGDAYVSGRHAEIVTDPTGTYLTDLGSTNGTVVNGQRLAANERQLLLEGDEVQIGQTRYRFELLGASDVSEPIEGGQDSLPPPAANYQDDMPTDTSLGGPWRPE